MFNIIWKKNKIIIKRLILLVLLCLFPLNAQADEVLGNEADLHGPLSAGGLTLKQYENIEILSQELYISEDKIEVNYVFQNNTNNDIKTIVAFPLPAIAAVSGGSDFIVKIEKAGAKAKKSFIDFDILVEGNQVTPEVIKKGFLSYEYEKLIFFLPDESMIYDDTKTNLDETDSIQVTYYWEQNFPVGKPVHAKLVYKPITGANNLYGYGIASPSVKDDDFLYDESCMKDIAPTVLKKIQRSDPSSVLGLSYVGYVFLTQANWAGGTIGNFRLVVNKGNAENLVSFCGENIKKISPAQFEMRATNYKPKDDLLVTIVSN